MMENYYYNFHIHTTMSDGCYSAQEVLQLATHYKGMRSIAFTEHNRIRTIKEYEALKQLYSEIELIPGVEISCNYIGKEVHVVGLYLNPSEYLQEFLRKNQGDGGRKRINLILERLRYIGIDLKIENYDQLLKLYPDRSTVGRSQLAEQLCKSLHITFDQAMDQYIGDNGSCFVQQQHRFSDLKRAIDVIHDSGGGIAVLAHPNRYKMSNFQILDLIDTFALAQGDAIEVTNHTTKEEERLLRQLAIKRGLSCSAGSDFHGRIGDELVGFDYKETYELRKRRRTKNDK